MPEKVVSLLGVLVGVFYYEDVIHSMPYQMRPGNMLVGFDHHRGIIPFFNHSRKSGVSNVLSTSFLCFNPLFYWVGPKLSYMNWSLLMVPSLVAPLAFPLAFISMGGLVCDEHPLEAVDLSIRVSTRPGN